MTELMNKSDLSSTYDAGRAYELDRAHVFHSWSAQAEITPMVVTRAEGSHVWDANDTRYLDFSSQLVFTNLGHQHPRIVAAIQEQAAHLCTIAPAVANGARSEAARLIASHTPGDLDHVFFTNGGADANEHAVRMARLHTGRHKVLTTYRSYHGGTHLAVNMTGDPRRWASDHGSTGTVHFFGPFLYRSAFHATTEAEECERALEHLEQVVALEGPAHRRRDRPRGDPRHRRDHGPAAGLPRRRPRDLRPPRHRADRRRGDVGLRPRRSLVRGRARRRSRPT